MESHRGPGRVAATVILYYPDENFITNLRTYYAFAERIYVFDNTDGAPLQVDWSLYPKVFYFHDGKNLGLPVRLNSAARRAIAEGYQWLLTMDQDSRFSVGAIQQYQQCFESFPEREKVALFGPLYFREDRPAPKGCIWQETVRVITSGALMNLNLFERIGGFDEQLFIDSVDHEYCIKAKLAGFSIIEFQSVCMIHEVGTLVNRSSFKTLFLVKKQKEIHSPLRNYYMVRNLLYLKRKFKGRNIPLMPAIEQDVIDKLKKTLFYGRSTTQLIRYLILAYRHFRQNKMGKLQQHR